jgi:hypothetical protein
MFDLKNSKDIIGDKYDLKTRDDGILIQLLAFWTLSTALFGPILC